MNGIEILTISADEKIINGSRPSLYENQSSIFQNEVGMFQIAYRGENTNYQQVQIKVNSELAKFITIREVKPVVCSLYNRENCDGYSVVQSAGAVSDILKDFKDLGISIRYNTFSSIFVTVKSKKALPKGTHKIIFTFLSENQVLADINYTINVLEGFLPETNLITTNWFHYDCLCDYYHVKPFSNKFYSILKKQITNYVEHGMTMLLTPLFTPPLDTQINGERRTIQLVKISCEDNKYNFDFTELKRFMKEVEACGIKFFEFSHLFTQWGAWHAPKIVKYINNKEIKLFGWETNSLSDEYLDFLAQFLSGLREFILNNNYIDKIFIHISDEPNLIHLQKYGQLRQHIKKYFKEAIILDAISDYSFYEKGYIDMPVVSLDHTEKFILNNVQKYCVYYCMGQRDEYVANGLISTPPERTRILGFQMFLNKAKGFLHCGYNFYNSVFSIEKINPFYENDCGGAFQSGDGFFVYPNSNGEVIDSLRHEYLLQAMQDYRVCLKAAEILGEDKVIKLLKENGMENYKKYTHSAIWLNELRCKIINEITNF